MASSGLTLGGRSARQRDCEQGKQKFHLRFLRWVVSGYAPYFNVINQQRM